MEHDSKKRKTENDGFDEGREDGYFHSYGLIQCHQAMVSDKQRTLAFKLSILRSYSQLYKKTVLEIGCGTGILSIFACQAGVDRVFAVEASQAIHFAQRVIDRNGYSDRISLVKNKIEGYVLFSEWMLPSVISTRDRMLKEGGLLFPDTVSMFIALASETDFLKSRAEYWRNGPSTDYTVDMSVLADEEYKSVIGKIAVHEVEPTAIVSAEREIVCLDLHTIKYEECQYFTAQFHLTAFGSCDIYGFCLWFKTFFPAGVDFDTSPFCAPTHWEQSMLYVAPFPVKQDTVVNGSITFYRHPTYTRILAIDLKYATGDDVSTTVQFHEIVDA